MTGLNGATWRAGLGGLAAAAALLGLAVPAAAQQRAIRQARDEAAAEFVAEAYPMTDELRARAQAGRILPYCNMRYPDTASPIGDERIDLPPAEQTAIAQAVDMQVVRQNLVAAGAEGWLADAIARGYRTSREAYDGKSEAQQQAARQAGEDPDSATIKMANLSGRLFGLPTFVDDETCQTYAFSVYRTPFRLVTEPPGASVYVIPRFSFRVCEKRLADPYSRDSRRGCAAWVKVPQGGTAALSGLYQYSVEWPDGAFEREQTNFDYVGEDGQDVLIASKPSP